MVFHFLECPGVRSVTLKLENSGEGKCALNGVCANFYQLNEFVSSTLSGRAGRRMFFSQFPALQDSPRLLRASHVDGTTLGPRPLRTEEAALRQVPPCPAPPGS